jgi:osmotically inducible lipoprotein OsmB
MMKTVRYSMAILVAGSMLGCAGMTETQQTTLSGGAIGAAGGAALGAITGGGAAGALGGYIVGETNKQRRYDDRHYR